MFEQGSGTFGDVATYWQVEKPTITPVAQKLIAQEIIFIEQGVDKRQKVMHLTEQGERLYQEIKHTMNAFQDEIMQGITDEEREIAEKLLTDLRENLLKRG
ncbi:MarR family winged helix-turn-helix transcriptional regulator [Bacillus massiliigorillae]|uniref:MarR family winged helix-turn-helix transcriptional regulator n=1 Tax=Bacillus massiliigorillae TaxID=1243664 RepID=UPI00039BFC48|nr:MarR family transcriptional regulator [Bacillus massiliigorillae]